MWNKPFLPQVALVVVFMTEIESNKTFTWLLTLCLVHSFLSALSLNKCPSCLDFAWNRMLAPSLQDCEVRAQGKARLQWKLRTCSLCSTESSESTRVNGKTRGGTEECLKFMTSGDYDRCVWAFRLQAQIKYKCQRAQYLIWDTVACHTH